MYYSLLGREVKFFEWVRVVILKTKYPRVLAGVNCCSIKYSPVETMNTVWFVFLQKSLSLWPNRNVGDGYKCHLVPF